MMRWVLLLVAFFLMAEPAVAQRRPAGYQQAEQSFSQLTVDERIKLQVLLTANGYWPAVPNVNFSNRLFEAISNYQRDYGRIPNGAVDADLLDQVLGNARPLLQTWNLRAIPHPSRGHPIWVPLGLGLVAKRDENGISWSDPKGRVSLAYSYFDDTTLVANYQGLLERVLSEGGRVHYKILKPDFFVVSMSTANGLDAYIRFHEDGRGVLGFFLFWKGSETHLHMERVATLISGSLWAAMTGASFTEAPTMTPPQETVAVARPSEPKAPAPTPKLEADGKSSSSGTGFVVSREGHVLTNAHVVDRCSSIDVKADNGDVVSGRVLAKDTTNDLALLRTPLRPSKVAGVRLGIRLGEGVAAFGFPLTTLLSSSGNFTLGNVTALSGLKDDSRYLQVSAPVQPGNSGGPLFDQNGNVVGVVSAKLNALNVMVATNGDIPQNVNFAIKGSLAASFLESNQVSVEPGTASQVVAPADLADQAKQVSVLIRCE
jgi:S1-C subfamily serine protease